MGSNFYLEFPKSPAWPPALRQGELLHLFKRSAAGGGRLRFTWAQDPVSVVLALSDMHPSDRPFRGLPDESISSVLDDLQRADTVHDYSMIGTEFS